MVQLAQSQAFVFPIAVPVVQILRGDGSDSHYHSKVFLGTDGAPITFTVSSHWQCQDTIGSLHV
jgi:hypothetical protein